MHYRRIGLTSAEFEGHLVSTQKSAMPVTIYLRRVGLQWAIEQVKYGTFTLLSSGHLKPPDIADEEVRDLVNEVFAMSLAHEYRCASYVPAQKCESLFQNFSKIAHGVERAPDFELTRIEYSDTDRTAQAFIRYKNTDLAGKSFIFLFYYQPFSWKLLNIKLVE